MVDAKNEHYEFIDDYNNKVNVTYRIPKIVINGNETNSVNKEILQKYEKQFIIAEELSEFKSWELSNTELDYKFYVNYDILSVLIYYKFPNNNYIEYSVYDLDIYSGEQLNNQEIADRLSLDYSKIKQFIVDEIKNAFSELDGHEEYFINQYEQSISDENINYSSLYIGENNQLMAVYRIYWVAGAGTYYHLMPITIITNNYKIGDIDGDGEINVNDVTDIQKYVVQLKPFTDEQMKFADVDKNGKIDVNDVTLLQKVIVKIAVI